MPDRDFSPGVYPDRSAKKPQATQQRFPPLGSLRLGMPLAQAAHVILANSLVVDHQRQWLRDRSSHAGRICFVRKHTTVAVAILSGIRRN